MNLKLLKATLQSEKAKLHLLDPEFQTPKGPNPIEALRAKIIDELFEYDLQQLASFEIPKRYYDECFELLIAAWRRRIHHSFSHTLALDNMTFSKSSFKAFAVALSLNVTLKALRLERCHLKLYEMQLLSVFVKIHPNLIFLHLDHNPLTDEGIAVLTPALAMNEHIEHLSLIDTELTDQGALKIYDLIKSRRFKTLRLDKNHLTEKSLLPIRKVYQNSHDLFMYDEQ